MENIGCPRTRRGGAVRISLRGHTTRQADGEELQNKTANGGVHAAFITLNALREIVDSYNDSAPAGAHLDCAACQRQSGEYESHRQSPPPPACKPEIYLGRLRRDDRAHTGRFVWGLMSIVDPNAFEPVFRQNWENARRIKSERIWSVNIFSVINARCNLRCLFSCASFR